jgi:hypothetical protein
MEHAFLATDLIPGWKLLQKGNHIFIQKRKLAVFAIVSHTSRVKEQTQCRVMGRKQIAHEIRQTPAAACTFDPPLLNYQGDFN